MTHFYQIRFRIDPLECSRISPPSYGTCKFIRVFTKSLHRILSWARWNQSTNSRYVSRGANFIPYSIVCKVRPVFISLSDVQVKLSTNL